MHTLQILISHINVLQQKTQTKCYTETDGHKEDYNDIGWTKMLVDTKGTMNTEKDRLGWC